jgi:hypothetical protein
MKSTPVQRQVGEIRSIVTSCGATVRVIAPTVVVSVCVHRSRTA